MPMLSKGPMACNFRCGLKRGWNGYPDRGDKYYKFGIFKPKVLRF